MSSLNAVIFGAIAAIAVAGTDFVMAMQAKAKVGESYGFWQHFDARMGGVMDLMPGTAVAKAMPDAPDGWTVREAVQKDTFVVAGLPDDPVKLAMMEEVEAKMIEALPGMQMANRLYQNGDMAIYFSVNFLPANIKSAKAAYITSQMFAMFDAQASAPLNPDAGMFALRKYSAPDFGTAAVYYTHVEGQLFISALSNAGDEATLSLMSGLDVDALQKMMAQDPTIGQAKLDDDAAEKADGCVQKGAAKFCAASN